MKYLIPFFLLFSISLSAQDRIVTLSNDTLECTILNVDVNFIQFTIDGKASKMMFTSASSIYRNGKWDFNERADRYSTAVPVEESIMKRQPVFMAAGVSEKQKNHIYSAGIFLEKGTRQIFSGLIIIVLSSVLIGAVSDSDSNFGLIIGAGGLLVGTGVSLSGVSKFAKAGRELQSFPYD